MSGLQSLGFEDIYTRKYNKSMAEQGLVWETDLQKKKQAVVQLTKKSLSFGVHSHPVWKDSLVFRLFCKLNNLLYMYILCVIQFPSPLQNTWENRLRKNSLLWVTVTQASGHDLLVLPCLGLWQDRMPRENIWQDTCVCFIVAVSRERRGSGFNIRFMTFLPSSGHHLLKVLPPPKHHQLGGKAFNLWAFGCV